MVMIVYCWVDMPNVHVGFGSVLHSDTSPRVLLQMMEEEGKARNVGRF